MTPLKIAHRVNTVEKLLQTPDSYGIEVDLRPDGARIILQHDAFTPGEDFEEYLDHYRHKFLILNTKSEGMEERLLDLMRSRGIENFFFLDLSLPFLIRYARKGVRKIAVRFSEYESLDFATRFGGLVDWVWVDCFNGFPLNVGVYRKLKKSFKICLVSPELQGHPIEWIDDFKVLLQEFEIDAICTKRPELW